LGIAGLGEVQRVTHRYGDLIPAIERNPLQELLQRFCPEDTHARLICNPHAAAKSRGKAQDQFEQHVSWLLSCFGYSPIVLGKYEGLEQPGTNTQ
jgi:hypothetical protein